MSMPGLPVMVVKWTRDIFEVDFCSNYIPLRLIVVPLEFFSLGFINV